MPKFGVPEVESSRSEDSMVARWASWDGYSEVKSGYAARSSVSSVEGQWRTATGNGRERASR